MNKREFVINEYNQAEKTLYTNYNNLMVMAAKLRNGHIVVEHCICKDPEEFDFVEGTKICKEKIINHLFAIYDFRTIQNPENIKRFSMKAK